MGIVSEYLIDHIRDHIERHHTVVWFDPGYDYQYLAGSITVPDTLIIQHDPGKGFLALRREIENLWSGDQSPPKMVLYIPMHEEETQHALAEYTAVGACLAPGRQPPEWNTRLAVIARNALKGICPEATIQDIVANLEAGRLSLDDVEKLAEDTVGTDHSPLKLIYGTGNPEQILLSFVADPSFDREVEQKDAVETLEVLASQALGHSFGDRGLVILRAKAQRFVLSNEFLDKLGDDIPKQLGSLPHPDSSGALQTLQRITQSWRKRRDLTDQYQQAALTIGNDLRIADLSLSMDSWAKSETFPQADQALQRSLEEALISGPSEKLDCIVRERAHGYWASEDPVHTLRWRLIEDANEVLSLANKVAKDLKQVGANPADMVRAYAMGESPWCALDTAYRHLERDWHQFDMDPEKHETLQQLVSAAQNTYTETIDHLTDVFTHALEQVKFELPGVKLQIRTFRDFVEPSLSSGITAYILVDAMRFEMARELMLQLGEHWRVELDAAFAAPPTVTEIGMAALMPGADEGLNILDAGGGKLIGEVRGAALKSREDRVKHLIASVEVKAVETKLSQIAPLTKTQLRKQLKEAKFILVTATDEIDGLWENNPALARRVHDDVFEQLRRGIRTLFSLGVTNIVLSADHGYIFGERLAQGELIDAPGGETVDLHRRVWVGRGGAAIPGCLRVPISAFGHGGDLELVTPYNLACFKAGGSMEYFHGGISLQEAVVPILSIEPVSMLEPLGEPAFTWQVEFGSEKVTTRFFSVTINGEAQMLFNGPPSVKAELRDGDIVISEPVSASYGFDESTREVSLEFDRENSMKIKANTITLLVPDKIEGKSVSFHLLDAETGLVLQQKESIPFDIAL